MAGTLDIQPLDATFGAVVRGIKVTGLDEATWRELYAAWLKYALANSQRTPRPSGCCRRRP